MIGRACLVAQLALASLAADTTLDIYVIPHSHQDLGYKKTVEGYFLTQVSRTLSSVAQALSEPGHEDRRFVWAEAYWLARWFMDPVYPKKDKDMFKRLVKNGQIELVDGGWAMHDDAATTLEGQVMNLELGHQFLAEHFGADKLPKIGWHIDPFGPTSVDPTVFALSGYDVFVTNRIPEDDKERRKRDKALQFVWEGSASLPRSRAALLTHVLDTHYQTPSGFDWEPALDYGSNGTAITPDNVQSRADAYVEMAVKKSAYYLRNSTGHISVLIPFGGDFEHQNSSWQFHNMDQLVKFINSNGDLWASKHQIDVNIRYATAGEFFSGLHKSGLKFPTVTASPFIPLWQGYYSGYASLKQDIRELEELTREAEIWSAVASLSGKQPAAMAGVVAAKQTAAVMTHHDNTPGTGYFFNTRDNLMRTQAAIRRTKRETLPGLLQEIVGDGVKFEVPDIICPSMGETKRILVTNTQGRLQQKTIEVTTCRDDLLALDVDDNVAIRSEVFRNSGGDGLYTWRFGPIKLPALGWKAIDVKVCYETHSNDYVTPEPGCALRAVEDSFSLPSVSTAQALNTSSGIVNPLVDHTDFTIQISEKHGISWIYIKSLNKNVSLPLSFHTYDMSGIDNAYRFEPANPSQELMISAWQWKIEQVSADSKVTSARITLYPNKASDSRLEAAITNVQILIHENGLIEPRFNIQQLPRGINLVARLKTMGGDAWQYLENGYEVINGRIIAGASIGRSYFPMTHGASVCSPDHCTLFATREVYGHTYYPKTGEVEIMLHRRTPTDLAKDKQPKMDRPQDYLKGDDSSSVTVAFVMQFTNMHDIGDGKKTLEFFARSQSFVPLVILQKTDYYDEWGTYGLGVPCSVSPVKSFEAMKSPLPGNVLLHSLSMEPAKKQQREVDDQTLRLHLRDVNLQQAVSLSPTFFTFNLFSGKSMEVLKLQETGLTFERSQKDVEQRLLWNGDTPLQHSTCLSADNAKITMSDRNICSFRLSYDIADKWATVI